MFGFGLHMYDDGMHGRAPAVNGAFTRRLRVHSLLDVGRFELENGDKIILPSSALDALTRLHIVYPMMFRIQGASTDAYTHCGVIEFVAEEGHAYIPSWMMVRLNVVEGAFVTIQNANLPKGTDVKFQPQTEDFLNISNQKVVLEATLRQFTCLTVGDSLPIHYNNKVYMLDVISLQPGSAVSIVEADVRTEFEAPPGYVEPTYGVPIAGAGTDGAKPPSLASSPQNVAIPFGKDAAGGDRLVSRLESLRRHTLDGEDSSSSDEDAGPGAAGSKGAARVVPFSGTGQALSANVRRGSAAVAGVGARADADGPQGESTRKEGSSGAAATQPFVPFGGAGRSLRD
ncbi:Ubiquitin fusion degradation protein 1-like [Porphyridium purpureum]|uniref:Ubiquitin fusion degradation protein 1-like n=1 Tax=Porphyridium purpureum TaxID=35688 RepID=A0A5J4ZA93_PORPP|nr:Ubiquitin fusion degradation protein 1-like [Porphyridium purpureum]|eukprot:POR2057..scf295_1